MLCCHHVGLNIAKEGLAQLCIEKLFYLYTYIYINSLLCNYCKNIHHAGYKISMIMHNS